MNTKPPSGRLEEDSIEIGTSSSHSQSLPSFRNTARVFMKQSNKEIGSKSANDITHSLKKVEKTDELQMTIGRNGVASKETETSASPPCNINATHHSETHETASEKINLEIPRTRIVRGADIFKTRSPLHRDSDTPNRWQSAVSLFFCYFLE